mmetsp:Transcript_49191/g.115055  ORF Transcript_49191/g.115055 Transcript_49191/m.115055 type:complete len:226 (+) Transcript_49191:790-1467(+)
MPGGPCNHTARLPPKKACATVASKRDLPTKSSTAGGNLPREGRCCIASPSPLGCLCTPRPVVNLGRCWAQSSAAKGSSRRSSRNFAASARKPGWGDNFTARRAVEKALSTDSSPVARDRMNAPRNALPAASKTAPSQTTTASAPASRKHSPKGREWQASNTTTSYGLEPLLSPRSNSIKSMGDTACEHPELSSSRSAGQRVGWGRDISTAQWAAKQRTRHLAQSP